MPDYWETHQPHEWDPEVEAPFRKCLVCRALFRADNPDGTDAVPIMPGLKIEPGTGFESRQRKAD